MKFKKRQSFNCLTISRRLYCLEFKLEYLFSMVPCLSVVPLTQSLHTPYYSQLRVNQLVCQKAVILLKGE